MISNTAVAEKPAPKLGIETHSVGWSVRVPRRRTHELLLVGRNHKTRRYLEELHRSGAATEMVSGYLDLANGRTHSDTDRSEDIFDRLHIPCLGRVDDLEDILSRHPVDEVYITLPIKTCYDEIEQAARICQEAGVPFSLSADLFGQGIEPSNEGSIKRIIFSCVPYHRWELAAKRAVDIVGSLAALVLLAVPMLLIALAVRLTSRGPIFFRQQRVGLNHKPFVMLKFRTMVVNAESMRSKLQSLNEQQGPVFKITNDPRVTRVGRFLRKYSLDELPQLFNVLAGEMSLVGPRPPLASEVREYEWWQRRRLSMRPGLTCFWQVMGRNRIGFQEWMRLDLKYIDNWSLALDIQLLLKTIPAVVRGSGAS